MKSTNTKGLTTARLPFLAGDLALDFLNTRTRVGREIIDLLHTDEDVFAWIKQAGLHCPKMGSEVARLSLLHSARLLRENIRSLVEKRKASLRGDPSLLNRFLNQSKSCPQLAWETPSVLTLRRVRQLDGLEGILAPIAEAAAVLLATADFRLIKRCEDQSCLLWFYDQTRSHRRRWCSILLCGNRNKVAAYRKRRHRAGARPAGITGERNNS